MARQDPTRRVLGWCLLVGGAAALIGALVGTVIGWVLIGDTQRASRDTLLTTETALTSVRSSLDLADQIVSTVREGMSTVSATLADVGSTVAAADATLEQLQQLTDALPGSLTAIHDAVGALAGVADTIDQTLAVVSQAPFVPDYHPATPLGALVRQLDQAVTPLAAGADGVAAQLHGALSDGTAITDQIGKLARDAGLIDRALASASDQLDTYRATATQAQVVATATRRDLDRDLPLARLVLVPFGLGLALTQLLPIWFGTRLLWPDRWPANATAFGRPPGATAGEGGLTTGPLGQDIEDRASSPGSANWRR